LPRPGNEIASAAGQVSNGTSAAPRSAKRSHIIQVLAPCAAGTALLLLTHLARAQTSSLIDLGSGTSAYGINASGQITGCLSGGNGATHAFLYQAGVTIDLGTLGGSSSCGYALNANGQVTGYALTPAGAPHAFLYSGHVMTDLGTVAGATELVGTAINASGEVTGYAAATPAPYPPPLSPQNALVVAEWFGATGPQGFTFLYAQGQLTQLIARPPSMGSAIGTGINDGGSVVAFEVYPGCNIPCPDGGAYLDLGGTVSALADPSLFFAAALAINTAGQVVGWGEDDSAYDHGLLFANGSVIDLGQNTEAFAINTSGQIVGAQKVGLYDHIGPEVDGFIYRAGAMQSLDIPGAYAAGINDNGWIVANNPTLGHAYLLSPTVVSVAPTGLSFGTGVIGVTASSPTCGACTVTITNGAASTQSLGMPALIGPFGVAKDTCASSLAPGATCGISLDFTPSGPDTNAGQLSIAIGGMVYAALLSGVGTDTVSLQSSSATVGIGVPFTLTWSATAGATCSASGGALAPNNAPLDAWTGTKPSSGSLMLSEAAAASLDFTLTCTDGSQMASAHAPVTIAPPTVKLSAAAASQAVGQPDTLTWTSSYATSCSATGGVTGDGWAGAKAVSGSAAVKASAAGVVAYTLTCLAGSATAKATTSVSYNAPGGGGGGLSGSVLTLLAALALRGGVTRGKAAARRSAGCN